MKLLYSLNNIKKYLIKEKSLYYINKDKNFFKDESIIESQVQDFILWKNKLIIQQTSSLQILTLSCLLLEKKRGVYFLSHSHFVEGSIFILREEEKHDYYFEISDTLHEEKVKWEDAFVTKILSKTFISQKQNLITCHTLLDGTEIWQFNLQLFAASFQDLNEIIDFNNYLIVSFNGIIVLEINTGNLIFRTEEMGYIIKLYGDKIYSTWGNQLKILNPIDFSIQTLDFNNTLKPLGIEIDRQKFVIVGDEFYFIRQKGEEKEAIVVILDLTTRELLWHTIIPIEEGSYWIMDLQVYNDRMYVLTQGGTLHIFEKELIN